MFPYAIAQNCFLRHRTDLGSTGVVTGRASEAELILKRLTRDSSMTHQAINDSLCLQMISLCPSTGPARPSTCLPMNLHRSAQGAAELRT
jgi:hypothetical protein